MKPDEITRQNIDQMLSSAGWSILSMENFKLEASASVAVREFHTKKDVADYLLFINGRVTGVIEVKPSGTALSPTADQTAKYMHGIPDDIPHPEGPIPFTYESCGTEKSGERI